MIARYAAPNATTFMRSARWRRSFGAGSPIRVKSSVRGGSRRSHGETRFAYGVLPRHLPAHVLERAHQIARPALMGELDRFDEVQERLLDAVAQMRHLRQRPEDARPILPAR